MAVDTWDEIRTAFHVARMGTVSGAADALGVHHATVIRHIDALEARLGVKLFQRHARGYTATEAGMDLFQVAQATDDQFGQLVSRIKGRGDDVDGELVVTSLANIQHLMSGTLVRFSRKYPNVTIRYLTGARVFKLQYGEAHVAIRAGTAPSEPDNVVQPFGGTVPGLYASAEYAERHGIPKDETDFDGHIFVGMDDPESRVPYAQWMREHVAPEAIKFRVTGITAAIEAVKAGAGLGFMTPADAVAEPGMVQVIAPREEWRAHLWMVTHVDLHRTTKVQAFLKFLKEDAKNWGMGL